VLVIEKPKQPSKLAVLLTHAMPLANNLVTLTKYAVQVVAVHILLQSRKAYYVSVKAARAVGFAIVREALRVAIHARVYLQEYWRWQKPRLQKFDKWLERQVKARQGETIHTFNSVIKEARKGAQELKANFETTRRQTHQESDEKLLGDSQDDAL
jgi:hypothetical protein